MSDFMDPNPQGIAWQEFLMAMPKSVKLAMLMHNHSLRGEWSMGAQGKILEALTMDGPEKFQVKSGKGQIASMWNHDYLAMDGDVIVAGPKYYKYKQAYLDGRLIVGPDGIISADLSNHHRVLEVVEAFQAAEAAGFKCEHGPRIHRNGTRADGKYWEGYFCSLPRGDAEQCEPVWVPYGEHYKDFDLALALENDSWTVTK